MAAAGAVLVRRIGRCKQRAYLLNREAESAALSGEREAANIRGAIDSSPRRGAHRAAAGRYPDEADGADLGSGLPRQITDPCEPY